MSGALQRERVTRITGLCHISLNRSHNRHHYTKKDTKAVRMEKYCMNENKMQNYILLHYGIQSYNCLFS